MANARLRDKIAAPGQFSFTFSANEDWRRGDSNPKRTETEPLHIPNNSATDCSEKPLEGSSEKQSHDTSEHFNTLSQHQFGANMVREDGDDPDLAKIVKTWPDLPDHIKAAIKALVQTHTREGK